jgi:beta-lactam-binding protein with PASTA domain
VKASGPSWRHRFGLERDFRERREMVERSRSAAWRVPIALIVATLGAGALGYLGVQLFLLPETLAESRLHRVPDLTGMRIDDAVREGDLQGYRVEASGRQYSDEIDEGDVIYQVPPPGSYLAQGDTVFALVSLGPQETRLPDLAGLDVEQARAVLNQLGVRVAGIRREASELLPQNAVVGSEPAAGATVEEEMEVVLRLSRGGAIVEMPDVRGLPQAAARDTLEIFGLTVGEVTELGVADSAEVGGRPVVVTGQEPGPRRPVPTGSAVRLELGFAPEDAPRPTAQGAARPSAPAAVPEDVTAGETPENEAARGQPGPADPGPPPDEEPTPDPVSPDDEEF